MDTSKEYIKMCENAVEIQKIKKQENGNFIIFKPSKPEIMSRIKEGWTYADDYIWLPRQDQLQEMITEYLNLSELCDCFDMWRVQPTTRQEFTSMEQLWLAFVMKEKYNKTWNGEEWIKE